MLEEDEIIDYSLYDLGELQEIIGVLEEQYPKDRRKKKEWDEWKKLMNQIFDIYNKKAESKIYATIK